MTDIHSFNEVIFMNNVWMYIALTCIFELIWVWLFATATALSHWLLTLAIITTDFYFLIKACEVLPTGSVYAIFSGVGTIGTALMDILLFGANFTLYKGLFMTILILGVVSLKMADNQIKGGG